MNTTQVNYFLMLAELQNFTTAAEHLYTSQPTLSRQIKNLEDEIGVRLFTRRNNSVWLTPAGQEFYIGLRKIYHDYGTLREKVQATEKGLSGEIRIGVLSDQLVDDTTQLALEKFHNLYPNILITFRRMDYRQIHSELLKNTIDIGLTFKHNESFDSRMGFFGEQTENSYLAVSRRIEVPKRKVLKDNDIIKIANELPFFQLSTDCYERNAMIPRDIVWEKICSGSSDNMPRRYIGEVDALPIYISTGLAFTVINATCVLRIDPLVRFYKYAGSEKIIKTCCYCKEYDSPIIKNFKDIYDSVYDPENIPQY